MLLNYRTQELESSELGKNHGPGAPRMFDNGAQEYFLKYGGGIEHLAKIGRPVCRIIHGHDANMILSIKEPQALYKQSLLPISWWLECWAGHECSEDHK